MTIKATFIPAWAINAICVNGRNKMKRRRFLFAVLASLLLPHTYLRPSATPKDAIYHGIPVNYPRWNWNVEYEELQQLAMKHNIYIITAMQKGKDGGYFNEEEISCAFQEQGKGVSM